MRQVVVDTNVPIVANGRADSSRGGAIPSPECRLAAIKFLEEALSSCKILLDLDGEIQKEYQRYLNPSGAPGVGDRFYLEMLNSLPRLVIRTDLPRNGIDYIDFPGDPELNDFDPSDRKFAAMARRTGAHVVNATDSDWLHHRDILARHGIDVDFVCGCDQRSWYVR